MKKKVLAIMLTMAMVVGLAACGSEAPASTDNKTETVSETKTDTTVQPEEAGLDPVTIKMYFHGSNVTDDSQVMKAVNEYLQEKINVTLEPIWGTWGDFDTNAVMALQGGDDIDIYFTCSWSADEYNLFAKRGAWVRLDDPANNILEKYGKDVWNLLPNVLTTGAKIEGANGYGVYAVPGYKDIACQLCWDINVPLLEKYGYTVDDIKNTDYYGFEEILAKVKAGEGDSFYPLLVEGAVAERMVDNTIIVAGDSGVSNLMSYYLNPNKTSELGAYGNVILNKFATPEYKKFVDQTRKYYLAGYIDPSLANAEQANNLRTEKQLTGQYLIGTQSYSLGYEIQASKERGFEVAMVGSTPAYVDTTSSQGAMMAISTASKNPERAMMFLNLLNTDPYLFTLLDFGVEGIHYNKNEIGEVVFTDARSNYQPWTNGMGNVTLLPPQEGQGADFWTGFKAYYGAADEIPILGFTFNPDNVTNEMAAVANAASEYALTLSVGAVDPDTVLPDFLAKLDANGMQKIIDEANAQLTAFLASKGK